MTESIILDVIDTDGERQSEQFYYKCKRLMVDEMMAVVDLDALPCQKWEKAQVTIIPYAREDSKLLSSENACLEGQLTRAKEELARVAAEAKENEEA